MVLSDRDSLELAGAFYENNSLSPQIHSKMLANPLPTSVPTSSTVVHSSSQPFIDFDNTNSSHQPRIQPDHETGEKTRPKQEVVTMTKNKGHSRRGGRGGRGGCNNTTERATESATPGPESAAFKFKLKLRFGAKSTEVFRSDTNTVQDVFSVSPLPLREPSKHIQELSLAQEQVITSCRSGREIRRPKGTEDFVLGSELDQAVDLTSVGKADDEDYHRPELASSPPYYAEVSRAQISQLTSKRQQGRATKGAISRSVLGKVDDNEDEPSSDTIVPLSPIQFHHNEATQVNISDHVFTIINDLRNKPNVTIDLPALSDIANPNRDRPYSSKLLIHLYLLAYQSHLWNLCDLIADTWIRAFHTLRDKRKLKPKGQLWRPNAALEKRRKEAEAYAAAKARSEGKKTYRVKGVGYDECAPDYKLDVDDPELDLDVTDFDSTLLNLLYCHTKMDCGARLLWADAMTLGGNKMEEGLNQTTADGHTWHPDLIFNIMCSSLRMVRRKMSLKIEESCEGAWCKRYHEHSKKGLPCYRELAWRHANEEDDGDFDKVETIDRNGTGVANGVELSVVDGNELDAVSRVEDEEDLATLMEAELSRVRKHAYKDLDGGEMSAAKRVRFRQDVVDLDAEGESEEE